MSNKSYNMWGVSLAKFVEGNKTSFSIKKTYKDKTTDEYKETKSFFVEDLMRLRTMIDKALSEEITERMFQSQGSTVQEQPAQQEDDGFDEDIPF